MAWCSLWRHRSRYRCRSRFRKKPRRTMRWPGPIATAKPHLWVDLTDLEKWRRNHRCDRSGGTDRDCRPDQGQGYAAQGFSARGAQDQPAAGTRGHSDRNRSGTSCATARNPQGIQREAHHIDRRREWHCAGHSVDRPGGARTGLGGPDRLRCADRLRSLSAIEGHRAQRQGCAALGLSRHIPTRSRQRQGRYSHLRRDRVGEQGHDHGRVRRQEAGS